ncbi:hypothetical protein H8E88_31320 [candidate division KSB1 bacterium]|nr:hypothetical protein [candidate division KSB1 bacterium]
MKKIIILIFIIFSMNLLQAAVGCSLNEPDKEVKRFFPSSTGYKTEYISIASRGGEETAKLIETNLRDTLNPKYEGLSVDYSYYTILKGKEIIGRIHGVNQKGIFGGMQLILATDTTGIIVGFFIQKISSPHSKKFKNKNFTDQFIELSLQDFNDFHNKVENNKISKIKTPSEKYKNDFDNLIRGLNKNMILLDIFKLDKKNLAMNKTNKKGELKK